MIKYLPLGKMNACYDAELREAVGRVCAAPAVACPPAVPIAVSGEILTPEAVGAFLENGIDAVRVCK